MMYNVYSIRDRLIGFGPLTVEPNDDVATRNFGMLRGNPDVPLDDLELYQIGTYDTVTGVVAPCVVPLLVCRGDSLKGCDDNAAG